MNAILRLFAAMGWGVSALIMIVIGGAIGFGLGRFLKKQWPPEYDELDEAIEKLDLELNSTDESLDSLWKRANFRLELRMELQQITTDGSQSQSQIHPLTLKLINLKNKAKRINVDMVRVNPWLRASQINQSRDVNAEVENTGSQIPIGRRDPDDPNPSYYGEAEADQPRDSSRCVADSLKPPVRSFGSAVTPLVQRQYPAIAEEFVALYNRAVTDQLSREEFRERFKPLRIGTLNAVERSQNPTLQPEISETTDGNLFASVVSDDNQYAVVPRLGFTIEAVSYGAGALGDVFSETDGHDPKLYYSRYRVVKPAIFKKRADDNWELESPGKLDLGPGD
jgi:hypothetical protein